MQARGHRHRGGPQIQLTDRCSAAGQLEVLPFSQQWERQTKAERQAMAARARQLISGEPIDWS